MSATISAMSVRARLVALASRRGQQARFEFAATAEAVAATFARRSTPLTEALPVGLSDEFSDDPSKQAQWHAFLDRTGLTAPPLAEVVAQLRSFLWPLLSAPSATSTQIEWRAGGPWQPRATEIER